MRAREPLRLAVPLLALLLAWPLPAPARAPARATARDAGSEATGPRRLLGLSLAPDDAPPPAAAFWRIDPAASRVSFEGHSTLHAFTGTTSAIEGILACDPADPAAGGAAEVTIDARTLDTGNGSRDAEMHAKHLESDLFPWIRFSLDDLAAIARDDPGGTFEAQARGLLEVHGVRTGVRIPIRVARHGDSIRVEGHVPLLMSRFGIDPPSKLWVIRVEDEVRVSFHTEASLVRPPAPGATSGAMPGESPPAAPGGASETGVAGEWISPPAEGPDGKSPPPVLLRIAREGSFRAWVLTGEPGRPRLRGSRGTVRREGPRWVAVSEDGERANLVRQGEALVVRQGDVRLAFLLARRP